MREAFSSFLFPLIQTDLLIVNGPSVTVSRGGIFCQLISLLIGEGGPPTTNFLLCRIRRSLTAKTQVIAW